MCLGIPGQVVEIVDPEKKLATVDVIGVRRVVNMTCVVDEENHLQSCLGEWVLVHVGFAMSRIDEAEANLTLTLLRELSEAQDEIAAMKASVN